jgi:hypothetical protein
MVQIHLTTSGAGLRHEAGPLKICEETMKNFKEYLGDGVYVELNSAQQLVLTTENGVAITNTIFLEPEVWAALVEYVARLRGATISGNVTSSR